MVTYIAIAVIILVAAIIFYRKKREKKMPAGLQVFDENGEVIFDLSHSTGRFIGSDTLSTTYSSGTVTKTIHVTKNTNSEKIFCYLQLVKGDLSMNKGFNGGYGVAVIDDSANTIKFTVRWGTYTIYYGVYVP